MAMPDVWIAGIIKSIYKNTAVLNKIVHYYADCITLLTEAQSGFKKGYSTSDNIFVSSSLIKIFLV